MNKIFCDNCCREMEDGYGLDTRIEIKGKYARVFVGANWIAEKAGDEVFMHLCSICKLRILREAFPSDNEKAAIAAYQEYELRRSTNQSPERVDYAYAGFQRLACVSILGNMKK
jgi:hypothetical protein